MSPITEESAKQLMEAMTAALTSVQSHEMKLRALETALKAENPAVYRNFREELEKLQSINDGTKIMVTLDRLCQLLQK